MSHGPGERLLDVRNLRIEFPTRHGTLVAVDEVSFHVAAGEVLGMVGESGAGKSLTGAAIIGLVDPPGRVASGEVWLGGRRIDDFSEEQMRRIRGREVGIIFQDPLTSLNPLVRIGDQIQETLLSHIAMTRKESRQRVLQLLAEVGLPSPEERVDQYPHSFSGGMRQRVVIALAICADPKLIIADECTTALDVSTKAQILTLLRQLCRERGTALILITHDMGTVAEMADRVAVMYAGRIVELGTLEQVLLHPRHPYTRGLMGAVPTVQRSNTRLVQIDGTMPRLSEIPRGCAFHPRCADAFDRCRRTRPDLTAAEGRSVACWLYSGTQSGSTSDA